MQLTRDQVQFPCVNYAEHEIQVFCGTYIMTRWQYSKATTHIMLVLPLLTCIKLGKEAVVCRPCLIKRHCESPVIEVKTC